LQNDIILRQLAIQQTQATQQQTQALCAYIAKATFAPELIVVEATLWGCFWQGDVISPGYRLLVGELALLRSIEYDHSWPKQTTFPQYYRDLQIACLHPQAHLKVGLVAHEPCAMVISPTNNDTFRYTVLWYCATTGYLHAGYRISKLDTLHTGEFILPMPSLINQQPGLQKKSAQLAKGYGLVKRLDKAILQYYNKP